MPDLLLITPEQLLEADDEASRAAEAYADFVHQKQFFQELSKDMLASLKHEIANGEEKPDTYLEREARANAKWRVFRDEQIKLLREAGRREIQYESAKRKWESLRSALSTKREEIKRFQAV